MKVGLVYPQVELRGDPQAVHDIGVGAEQLGFDSLLVYDHVVGAEHDHREPPLWGPYTERDPFHEPLVMFGYLAAVTSRIELATGVMILPQRQTALVAQQVADADLFSRERVRLGVGTGWNYVEYDTLGQDFATRGPRLDEQIELLRHLWSQPLVTFQGRFDRVERACINPRPGRLIPIWIGGFAESAYRRGGRLGDGFTFAGDVDAAVQGMARVRHHIAEAGRSADDFGFELIATRARSATEVTETAERWRSAGGTHVSVLTIKLGLDTAAAHLDYASSVKECTRRSSRSTVMKWVLWSGTVGLESPVLDRFPAAATGGYDYLSLSPLDIARAAEQGLSAGDIRRRAGDDGLGLIVDPVMNWHPAAEPSRSRFARFGVDAALRMTEAVGAVSMTAIASSTTAAPVDELVELFGALCDRAADIGALVHLEFIPMTAIPDVATAWRIVRDAGRPNGGILFDTWHFFRGRPTSTISRRCPVSGYSPCRSTTPPPT